MSLSRVLGVSALVVLGCARSATDVEGPEEPLAESEAPLAEPEVQDAGSESGDDAEDTDAEAADDLDDPEAQHISFEGGDVEEGPTGHVVAPPKRPPMPSMMTDVLKTGPRP